MQTIILTLTNELIKYIDTIRLHANLTNIEEL